jgi:hypothetical protein
MAKSEERQTECRLRRKMEQLCGPQTKQLIMEMREGGMTCDHINDCQAEWDACKGGGSALTCWNLVGLKQE